MANFNTNIFKSLNESEYKELYTFKRTLTEATTDTNEVAEEYKEAYHIDLDWNRVPCVIARDKFLSGWGGAEGRNHYQIVLCGDSTEADNIEAKMRSLGREEGLANVRRDFGIHLPSKASKAYVVGRYASAWNDLSDSWYERFDGKSSDEDKFNTTMEKRAKKLKEEYSEKLGGDPEDFIKDVECIKIGLMSIHRSEMVTHLAQEMIDQFIETCDSQISMAKSRFLGESDDIEEFKKKYKKGFDNWKKENPEKSDKEIVDILKAKQYNGELNEDEDTIHKMKDCTDDVEVVMALEGDTLELDDIEDWNRLKELAKSLSRSQGFYGRLLRDMENIDEDSLEFPIYL